MDPASRPLKISGTATGLGRPAAPRGHIAYFDWPQMSAIWTIPVTVNVAFWSVDLVPLTCTSCPTYLAKTSLFGPADRRPAIFSIEPSRSTYCPNCSSMQPVKDCCATGTDLPAGAP